MSKSTKYAIRQDFPRAWWYSMYQHARNMARTGRDTGNLGYAEACCAANHSIAPIVKDRALQAAFGTRGDKLQYWLVNQARW